MAFPVASFEKKHKKRADALFFVLCFGKLILAYTAQGADKILGKVFPFRAGLNTVIGIAHSFVIFVSAYVTYVFHCFSPYSL